MIIWCIAIVRRNVVIDPRIPTMPGRSMPGLRRIGRDYAHQARSAVRFWASRINSELHATKNHS